MVMQAWVQHPYTTNSVEAVPQSAMIHWQTWDFQHSLLRRQNHYSPCCSGSPSWLSLIIFIHGSQSRNCGGSGRGSVESLHWSIVIPSSTSLIKPIKSDPFLFSYKPSMADRLLVLQHIMPGVTEHVLLHLLYVSSICPLCYFYSMHLCCFIEGYATYILTARKFELSSENDCTARRTSASEKVHLFTSELATQSVWKRPLVYHWVTVNNILIGN